MNDELLEWLRANATRVEIIKPTRVIGNAKLYQLNTDNLLVQKMIELFDEIIMPKRKIAA